MKTEQALRGADEGGFADTNLNLEALAVLATEIESLRQEKEKYRKAWLNSDHAFEIAKSELKSLRQENLALALQVKEMHQSGRRFHDEIDGFKKRFLSIITTEQYDILEDALTGLTSSFCDPLPDLSTEIVEKFQKEVEAEVWKWIIKLCDKSRLKAQKIAKVHHGPIVNNYLGQAEMAYRIRIEAEAQSSDQEAGG